MIELKGKYNVAKIYTDIVDEASISQVMLLLNQEFVAGSKIRLMPDIHAGSGCTIGTTMTISDKIVPNLVGVDIGCGIEVVQIKEKHIELQKLDKLIYEKIPSGFNVRTNTHRYFESCRLNDLHCASKVNLDRAEKVSVHLAVEIILLNAIKTMMGKFTLWYTLEAAILD